MASAIDICNFALQRIGTKSSIISLDEASPEAIACKLAYEQAVRTALRLHPWNFATASIALALLTNARPDWKFRYALPSDCVRALRIMADDRSADPIPFEVGINDTRDGRTIMCNREDAILVYTCYVADPTLYDSSFVDCLAWRLAADISMTVTGDRNVQNVCLNAWRSFMPEAAALDSAEGLADPNRQAPWITARG